MRVGFRVATDPRFGAGHLARCRAVAQTLDLNATLFADSAPLPGAERDHWAEIVSEDSAESASATIEAFLLGRIDVAVIDSYAVDSEAVMALTRAGRTVAFRDGPPYGPEWLTIDCGPGVVSNPM